jgi:hypothetical protein
MSDIDMMRPACPIVQAALGGHPDAADWFDLEDFGSWPRPRACGSTSYRIPISSSSSSAR